jgi:hypothetical protein
VRGRKFGVEIECGFKDGYLAAERLISREVQAKKIHDHWRRSLHYDGTLMETSSPALQGAAGFAELRYMMRLLRNNGAYITRSDGMHVHHDAPDYKHDKELQARLAESWFNNQRNIMQFVNIARWRRGACPPINKGHVDALKDGRRPYGRNALNFFALDEHGTLEFRIHEGCLHFPQAEAWIRFGQTLLNAVKASDKPLPKFKTCEELLVSIRVNKRATHKLLNRGNDETWDGRKASYQYDDDPGDPDDYYEEDDYDEY